MAIIKPKVTVSVNLSPIFEAIEKTHHLEVDDNADTEVDWLDAETLQITIPTKEEVKVDFYRGVHTLPNGDPGYPDEYDVQELMNWQEFKDNMSQATASVDGFDIYDSDGEIFED